ETQKSYLYAMGNMLHRQQLWYATEPQVLNAMRQVPSSSSEEALHHHLTYLASATEIIQLRDRQRQCYAFAHLAYQEYAVARYLINQVYQGEVVDFLLDHTMDPWWHEVIVIYASNESSEPFLRQLLDADDNIFCTRLLLLADCVLVGNDDALRLTVHDRL